jgi:TonB-dependent receptor
VVSRAPARWLVLLALASLPLASLAQEGTGSLRGIVLDRDFQVPLSGARVEVAGTSRVTVTGSDGTFLLENVPAGSQTLAISKEGFDREVMPGVVVTAGRLSDVRVVLAAEVVDLEEMVITGADLPITGEMASLEVREAAVSVQDAISADVMSKAGVGDVAGALKFVVGASITDGKYATVRGLSDRYTGTTLNGVRLPSADPRRRAVQVDLFPTGTIESLTVTKTFTPDLLGDFTGGGLDIRTRSIPDGSLFSVSGSLEGNSLTTGNDDYLTYAGGGVDPLGAAGGSRDMPGGADAPLPPLPSFTARPNAAQTEASRQYDSLVHAFTPVMGTSRGTAGLNSGYSLAAGHRFQAPGGMVFGLMGSVTQSRKHDFYEDGINNNAVVSDSHQGITVTDERTDSRGMDEVLVGGLVTFVAQIRPEHELSMRLVYNQSAEDEARLQIQDTGFPSTEQNQALHYTERMVSSAQVHGDHHLNWHGMQVEWTGSLNRTSQDEPDVRFFRNSFNLETLGAEMPANSTPAQNTRRIFRDVEEDNRQGSVNVTLPFVPWKDAQATFKAGLYHDASDRSYDQRSFSYQFATQFGSIFNVPARDNRALARYTAPDAESLWTDVFLRDDRIGLATNSPPAPNQLLWTIVPLGDDVDYTGDQRIQAAYAMADMPLVKNLRTIFGARYETTRMEVVPVNDAFGTLEVIEVLPSGDRAIVEVPQEQANAEIEEGELLPSVGLVYEPLPHMNLRATWSRTLARPTFRELAPVATEEFIFGDEFLGNPALSLSSITNYDLRWEWFRRQGEVLSASVFYKSMRDPIEMISFATGGRSFVQPVNFDRGSVRGAEVEVRMPLDLFGHALREWTVGVNATRIWSELQVPDDERTSLAAFGLDERTRRLQGQPEMLLNLNVAWDSERLGSSVALFYNLVGETLRTGAARGSEDGVPSVFEEPFGTVDLTYSQKLAGRFSVSFKARNLLAEDRRAVYRTPAGLESVKSERQTPVLYSLSGGWSW